MAGRDCAVENRRSDLYGGLPQDRDRLAWEGVGHELRQAGGLPIEVLLLRYQMFHYTNELYS